MDKALKQLGDYWARYRVIAAFLGLIIFGAMLAWTAAAWYFKTRLDSQYTAMNDVIIQLKQDNQYERERTQIRIERLSDELLAKLDNITDRLEALTPRVEQAGETANKAARQAGSAAEQAAKASIRIREYRQDAKPSPNP